MSSEEDKHCYYEYDYPISGLFIDLIAIGANGVQSILVSSPGAPGYNTIWQSRIDYQSYQNIGGLFDILDTPFNSEGLDGRTAIQIDDPYMSVWSIFGTAKLDPFGASDDTTVSFVPQDIAKAGPLQAVVSNFGVFFQNDAGGGKKASMLMLSLVFAFAALTASIRLFLSLLNAYLTLILYPIVMPILFLIAALPTMTWTILSSVLRTMLAASLSFVAVYGVFLTIIVISYEPLIQEFSFLPPLLGYTDSATLSSSGQLVRILIGYGLFLSTPIIPGQIKAMLETGQNNVFGQEIGDRTKQAGAGLLRTLQGITGGANKLRWGKGVQPKR